MDAELLRRFATMPSVRKKKNPKRRSADAAGTWQAEKSQLTQLQILDATMRCLVEIGYAQTTTDKIAQMAGVSRGAMTHHFKSRAAVFAAAAQHITELRALEYDDAVKGLGLKDGQAPTFHDMQRTMEMLQKYYANPSFLALHELLRGARTDETLRTVMVPLEEELDRRISASLLEHFPIWLKYPEVSVLLRDLILSTLQGLAIDPVGYVKGARLQRLMDLLSSVAMAEFEKAEAALREADAGRGARVSRKSAA